MSQDFMDAELFTDFIIEAREHLETIEPNLLELEKTPDNLGLLNEIFRPMHSLKGASGFLGLNRINQLAHKCENILDELRNASMVVTSGIMDVILTSTDALRQMLDNLEQHNSDEGIPIEEIISEIDVLMENKGELASEPSTSIENSSVEENPIPEENLATEQIDVATENTTENQTQVEVSISVEVTTNANKPDHEELVKINITPKEWLSALPCVPEYKLTAFGEGHLKDFIDESVEIVESLNAGLLHLEGKPEGQEELINDLFRFFHNLKGNSGIIGYQDLNGLTHEAETLLNNIRKGEMAIGHEIIDLLLFVVDVMEVLVHNIDAVNGTVEPPDTTEVLHQLREALAGGTVMLPRSMYEVASQSDSTQTQDESENKPEQEAIDNNTTEVVTPVIIPVGTGEDDAVMFRQTVSQQMEIISAAMETLKGDGGHKPSTDAIYRSLVAIKNACNFIKLPEIKLYAERTAGIVDSARKSDMDFGLVLDMLSQEVDIIKEMIDAANVGTETPQAEPNNPESEAVPVEKTEPEAPKDEPKPEPVVEVATPIPSPVEPTPAAPSNVSGKEALELAKKSAAAEMVKSSTAPATKPTAATKPTQAQDTQKPTSSTIRVDHEKLDHLMNLIGELIINRNRYTLIARSLEDESSQVDISHVAQSLSETTYAMARISDDLQDTIMKVRMVPVASVFSRFPRLVRDLSRKSGKEVDLVMEGEETELDKSVVEVIGDPLVHLIRNSVDHGIESQEDRIAAEKPIKGRVTLRAYHKGNSVAIEIEDDGKGIDPEKMREVAIRKGIINAEDAKQLDDREAMELIFAPGFSSAETITDISGRGVGMDVVRTNIKNLKGSVNISSEIGKGTRFTLLLPLTLAIIDALMVNVADEMFAIPLDAVSETTKIEAELLTDIKGRKAVTLRGEVLGIIELSELLNLPKPDVEPDVLSIVVIHDNDRRLGVVVDRLLERQEVVIKPLGSYLGDLKGISGATIMGDGSVILILDPHEVYSMSTSRAAI